MKRLLALLALSGAIALPAMAQMTPAETNLDQSAARMEKRNAQPGQLTAVSAEQATANALQRCANLPPFYKSDCEARVRGQGQVSGSVIGGGLVKESVTTMPKTELDAMIKSHQPMSVPAPRK
ncbi:hypothetical protein [Ottowia sp.]|jgi:hypothetical protein|uniref:hypothetical protein n=1 Tax=Ottowia sp. TaxID=1898956 RepID=UPI002C4F3D3C|nr:hypothetical protein [Ottowia sp.]HRN76911.1 hypothetical protein [Ottowia sp.]HRQ03695.1 hypothetical protein [Ottowia sp.]